MTFSTNMGGNSVYTTTKGIKFADGTEQDTAATPVSGTASYVPYFSDAHTLGSTGLLYDGVSEFFETNIGSVPTSITFGGILGNTIAAFMCGDAIPGSGKTGAALLCLGTASGVACQKTDGSSIGLSCDDSDPMSPRLELKMNGIGVTTTLTQGVLTLAGTTNGKAVIQCAASGSNPDPLQLPLANGTQGQVLITDGNNPQQLSWVSPTAVVVNAQKFPSNSAAINATALLTIGASGAGFYRISWCAVIVTPGSVSSTLGGTTGFRLHYSNANGDILGKLDENNAPVLTSNNTNGTSISGVTCGYVGTESVIEFDYDYASSGTPMVYALSVITEYLGA